MKCPKCRSKNTKKISILDEESSGERCQDCGHQDKWGMFMEKLPETSLIPVYHVSGIAITHDFKEAGEQFNLFIVRCLDPNCKELTVDMLKDTVIEVSVYTVNNYVSANRYNITSKQLKELEDKYNINEKILRDVKNGVM